MITKTTNLGDDYKSLWEKIEDFSDGSLKIENLEQFFGNIQEIMGLKNGQGIKFLRLPLDEPMFKIDANSRKIEIPDNFKANGLSVQGDHAAETVFFYIDRYFDYADLNNMDIRIKWKMGQNEGISNNFIKSADILPGYIVFGWPITKELTGKNGALSFAIEFYNDKGYSLNTLSHTANIKDGLIFQGDEVAEALPIDPTLLFVDSSFGEGDAAVADAEWVAQIGEGEYEGEALTGVKPYAEIINLETNILPSGEPASVPKRVFAAAAAGQDADIFYGNNVDTVFIKFAGETLKDNVVYYVKENANTFHKATVAEREAFYAEENPTELYQEFATIELAVDGSYFIKAQGVKYDENDNKIGAGNAKESKVVVVPVVTNPEVIGIEGPDFDINNYEGYSLDATASGNVIYITDAEGIELQAVPTYDNNGFGAIKYVWYKDDEIVENENWKQAGVDTLEVIDEGEYKVAVKTFHNGKITEGFKNSTPVVVSKLASIVSAEVISGLTSGNDTLEMALDTSGGYNANAVKDIVVSYEIDGECSDDVIAVLRHEGDNSNILTFTNADTENKTITCRINSNKLYPTSGEKYYIDVLNSYNGSVYTSKATTGADDNTFTVYFK